MSGAEQRHAPLRCGPGQLCPPPPKRSCSFCAWVGCIAGNCTALQRAASFANPQSLHDGDCCHESQRGGRCSRGKAARHLARRAQARGAGVAAQAGVHGALRRLGAARDLVQRLVRLLRAPRSQHLATKCMGGKVRSACRRHPARRQEVLFHGMACSRSPSACTEHLASG